VWFGFFQVDTCTLKSSVVLCVWYRSIVQCETSVIQRLSFYIAYVIPCSHVIYKTAVSTAFTIYLYKQQSTNKICNVGVTSRFSETFFSNCTTVVKIFDYMYFKRAKTWWLLNTIGHFKSLCILWFNIPDCNKNKNKNQQTCQEFKETITVKGC